MSPDPTDQPPVQALGLRARKQAAAMRHIQNVALDLFERRGYHDVTVTEIAAAADVGERSVYRYFGNKSGLVFHDELDLFAIDVFAERVAREPLLDAVRASIDAVAPLMAGDATTDAVRRLRLIHEYRELEAALADYTNQLGDAFGVAIATARGRPADDLEARIHGRCVIAALAVAVDAWYDDPTRRELIDVMRDAVDGLASL